MADPYVCARFKSQKFIESIGWLPRAALEIVPVGANPPVQNWEGTWRRDREAEIVIKSQGEDVTVAGNATWGGSDPERVKRGAINTGELEGSFRPRGQLLAIGYDPGRSEFPPAEDAAPDICAAKLELYGRYLIVEDNGKCGAPEPRASEPPPGPLFALQEGGGNGAAKRQGSRLMRFAGRG
jgi:hypothetical protein